MLAWRQEDASMSDIETGKLRVLVADDEELVRTILVSCLEIAGFDIVGIAVDGQQAVDMTCAKRPHIVLLDLEMPLLSGIEALKRIKAEAPSTLVVMCS